MQPPEGRGVLPKMETVRWTVAGIFYVLALLVVLFNLNRQRVNARRAKEGDCSRVSGIAALTTFFVWIGGSAAPVPLHWWALLALPFEIFAVADFAGSGPES